MGSQSEVKTGHVIAGVAGGLLLISMFFNWYGVNLPTGSVTQSLGSGNAFDAPGLLGGFADLVIFACAITAIGFLLTTLGGTKLELPMAPAAMTTLAGAIAAFFVFCRMIFQPGQNEYISLQFGIFFAFLMSIGILVGGYLVMQDEGVTFDRTDSRSGGGSTDAPPPRPPSSGPPA